MNKEDVARVTDTPLTANDCETQTYYGYSCGIVATLTTRAEQAEARVAELTAALAEYRKIRPQEPK